MSLKKPEASGLPPAGWRNWIEVPLVIAGGLLVFSLMGLSVSDALLRSFFNKPIFGANDYAQILLSFVVSLSFPLCVLAGRLIAIDTLVLKLPLAVQMVLDWMVTALGTVMLGYLSWRAFSNALEAATFGESTMLLQLPFGPSYYAVSAGCGLAALVLVLERITR
ncbi:TRAP transporter small permease [Roseibium sp. SCP14]|uniref:TRAP transporter small permease n=1 Tax=Roseibium sp. SCP14 TaxID=3141375 RepID=UPI00333D0551